MVLFVDRRSWWYFLCFIIAACWLTSVQYHSLNWSLVFIEHMSTRWCSAVVLLLFILWTESDTYIIIDGSPSIYKGLDTCYSATFMSQTRDQQRFTMSEVAAHRLEPMVPQRIMWPSIARANGQLDPRCSVAPISHTRPSPRSRSYYIFPDPLRVINLIIFKN